MLLDEAEALLAKRLLPAALAAFHLAEAKGEDPDRCSAGRWQTSMLLGDFEAAWRESDTIRARNMPDPYRFWNGQGLEGKRIILRCLHGLGDAVQFIRYLPLLTARVSDVTVQVPPALVELAQYLTGVTEVITWSDHGSSEPAWDMQIEVTELPYIFRTQLTDLPIASNYLNLPSHILSANYPGTHKDVGCRIGLVWSCGAWNPARNIPFGLLRAVLNRSHCEFWNLQGGGPRRDCIDPTVHQAEYCSENLVNLAALIAQLDLVITTDTLAAHLAGAIGTPAFVLLPYAADWRWLDDRADSPWYPNLRLFRQRQPNDWSSAISQVNMALGEFVRVGLAV